MLTFNDIRLDFAQRLSQGWPGKGPDFQKAAKIYGQIIAADPAQTKATTRNRARVNLAGMYLRGEGVPPTVSNPQQVAFELYKKVTEQPAADVLPEDLTRAQVALTLAAKKRKRED